MNTDTTDPLGKDSTSGVFVQAPQIINEAFLRTFEKHWKKMIESATPHSGLNSRVKRSFYRS